MAKNPEQQRSIRSMESDRENARTGEKSSLQKISVQRPSPQDQKKQEQKPKGPGQSGEGGVKEGALSSQTGAPPQNLPGASSPTPPRKPATPQQPSSPPQPSQPQRKTPPPAPKRPTPPSPSKKPPTPQPPIPKKKPPTGGEGSPRPRPPHSSGKRRRLLLLGLGAFVILLVIGAEIWWFFIRPGASQNEITPPTDDVLPAPEETLPAQTEEPAPPSAEEPSFSQPFLQFDRTETALIESLSPQAVQDAVSQMLSQSFGDGELVRLVLLVSSGNSQQEITLDQLAGGLGLAIPETVVAQLTQTANIFIFSPTVFDRNTCQEAGRDVSSCTGPRVGMVVGTTDSAALEASLNNWEPTMIRDLRPLIATSISGATTPFLDATYRGIPVRYRNLPLNTATIDYAVVDGRWLVTTSKSSMFSAIDARGN